MSKCCPPGSAPSFKDDYSPKGELLSLPEVEYYAVGTPVSGGTAVLICPDIWGWNSGRTRRFADLLVGQVGISYVVIPKLLTPPVDGGTDGDGLPPNFDLEAGGDVCWPWLGAFRYDEHFKPRVDPLMSLLRQSQMTVGCLGFCYGGWIIAHMAREHSEIACVVIPHPSLHVEEMLHKGDTAQLAETMTMPVLILPSGSDPDTYLPGGGVYEKLTANNAASKSVHFPEMVHGWTSRGDAQDDAVCRDIDKFWKLASEFFTQHLLQKKE